MDGIYDSVTKGLNEAIDLEKGKTNGSRRRIVKILPLPKYTGEQVKKIRNRLDLTQSVFVELMGKRRLEKIQKRLFFGEK